MNHFEFFDIPVSFYPDLADLKQRFLRNSKQLHPDFYTLESEEKQAEMLEKSTLNNEAYLTLSDFDKRLKYILELKDLLQDSKNDIPQEFLMDMMEVNEAAMELEFDFDFDLYQKTVSEVDEMEKSLFDEVGPIMEGYEDGVTPNSTLERVRDFFLKRRYLWRIKENLNRFAPASKEAH